MTRAAATRAQLPALSFCTGNSGNTGTPAANPHGCSLLAFPVPEILFPPGLGNGNSFRASGGLAVDWITARRRKRSA